MSDADTLGANRAAEHSSHAEGLQVARAAEHTVDADRMHAARAAEHTSDADSSEAWSAWRRRLKAASDTSSEYCTPAVLPLRLRFSTPSSLTSSEAACASQ